MSGRVYLAARYSRREELLRYREELQALGMVVTSRWLNGDHQIPDDVLEEAEAVRFAREDVEDLYTADCVVSFTEQPRLVSATRGGRHVEFGMAVPMRKLLVVVGPRENVFHWLPQVWQFDTWPSALAFLQGRFSEGVLSWVNTPRATAGGQ